MTCMTRRRSMTVMGTPSDPMGTQQEGRGHSGHGTRDMRRVSAEISRHGASQVHGLVDSLISLKQGSYSVPRGTFTKESESRLVTPVGVRRHLDAQRASERQRDSQRDIAPLARPLPAHGSGAGSARSSARDNGAETRRSMPEGLTTTMDRPSGVSQLQTQTSMAGGHRVASAPGGVGAVRGRPRAPVHSWEAVGISTLHPANRHPSHPGAHAPPANATRTHSISEFVNELQDGGRLPSVTETAEVHDESTYFPSWSVPSSRGAQRRAARRHPEITQQPFDPAALASLLRPGQPAKLE